MPDRFLVFIATVVVVAVELMSVPVAAGTLAIRRGITNNAVKRHHRPVRNNAGHES